MLISTVHLPRLYSSLPEAEHEQRTYCSLVIQCLQDAVANCILYVDADETLPKSVRKWPPKYSGRAKELLRKLDRLNRLVVWNGEVPEVKLCEYPECKPSVGIALASKPCALIASAECAPCANEQLSDVEVVSIDEYAVSNFTVARKGAESVALSDRDPKWSRARFEAEVLDPVLRHAKHVKIYDRYVGRHLRKRNGTVGANLSRGYSDTLEWIFQRFAGYRVGQSSALFEVVCGLDSDCMSDDTIREAAEVLRDFADQCSAKYGMPMSLKIKREGGLQKMRHARFLFTDQIAVMIERGFDLLQPGGKLTDSVVTLFEHRGDVESETGRLPDVP